MNGPGGCHDPGFHQWEKLDVHGLRHQFVEASIIGIEPSIIGYVIQVCVSK